MLSKTYIKRNISKWDLQYNMYKEQKANYNGGKAKLRLRQFRHELAAREKKSKEESPQESLLQYEIFSNYSSTQKKQKQNLMHVILSVVYDALLHRKQSLVFLQTSIILANQIVHS